MTRPEPVARLHASIQRSDELVSEWTCLSRLVTVFARDRIVSVQRCRGPLSTAVKPNAAAFTCCPQACAAPTRTYAASESDDRFSFYLARNSWEFVRTVSPLGMAVECHPIATFHNFRISVSMVPYVYECPRPEHLLSRKVCMTTDRLKLIVFS